MDKITLARHIDHTLLKPDAVEVELVKLRSFSKNTEN